MENIFLLYSRHSHYSGKKLAKELGDISCGNTDKLKECRMLIRWGASFPIHFRPEIVINKKEGILNAVNKTRTLNLLRDANIDVPKVLSIKDKIEFPCIRRPIYHKRAEGFEIVEDESGLVNFDSSIEYLLEFFNKIDDYRIYIWKSILLRAYKYIPVYPNAHPVIRNDDHGWRLGYIENLRAFPRGLIATAFNAVRSIGLDFGAVDMGINRNGRIIVYEINTAPFLDQIRLKLFAKAINMERRRYDI